MAIERVAAPRWFTIVAVVLLIWGLAGCWSFVEHIRFGSVGIETASDYDRRFYLALPEWLNLVYAVSVLGGLLGSVALIARSRLAIGFYGASLMAVVVQFGWVFLATDLIAAKGAAATVPFPLLIGVVAAVQLWLARRARRHGWIG